MFTGLVEGTAAVRALQRAGSRASGVRLVLEPPELAPGLPPWAPVAGESIALSGCCLTLVALLEGGAGAFDLSAETLARTWFGELRPGRRLNVERSLRMGDRLGGHLVSGHVEGRGRIVGVQDAGDGGRAIELEVEPGFERWLLEKGSVTVDGISLTVVAPRGRRFGVAAIPETLRRTTLGAAVAGTPVHLEADPIGRWVERLLGERGGRAPGQT